MSTYPIQKIGDPRRKQARAIKRYYKAMEYRKVALAGGGERECARRRRAFMGKFNRGWIP